MAFFIGPVVKPSLLREGQIIGDAGDVEVDDGLLAFWAEEEGAVGVGVHEEVFGAETVAGEVGLGGGVEGGGEGIGPGVSTGGVGALPPFRSAALRQNANPLHCQCSLRSVKE